MGRFRLIYHKEDYVPTRASDSERLPAVILKDFFCEYTRVMFYIVISILRNKFYHGFI